jgi:hypothetical protein
MKQNKWLYLSFIGFLSLLGLLAALDCNIGGVHDWRGNKAVFFGVSLGLLGSASIITLLIQTIKISQTPGAKIGGVLFVYALIFVGMVTVLQISKQYCH